MAKGSEGREKDQKQQGRGKVYFFLLIKLN